MAEEVYPIEIFFFSKNNQVLTKAPNIPLDGLRARASMMRRGRGTTGGGLLSFAIVRGMTGRVRRNTRRAGPKERPPEPSPPPTPPPTPPTPPIEVLPPIRPTLPGGFSRPQTIDVTPISVVIERQTRRDLPRQNLTHPGILRGENTGGDLGRVDLRRGTRQAIREGRMTVEEGLTSSTPFIREEAGRMMRARPFQENQPLNDQLRQLRNQQNNRAQGGNE